MLLITFCSKFCSLQANHAKVLKSAQLLRIQVKLGAADQKAKEEEQQNTEPS